MEKQRLQKIIANAGVTSRRKAEALIASGHVTVDGQVVTEMGVQVGPHSEITVDGVPLDQPQLVYFLFYKPRGVISAVSDDKKRKVVTDYFADIEQRVYPVGRLDYDTSGLLLMTNDGDFANHLMHPRFEIDKTYIAKVKGIPTAADLAPLKHGVRLGRRKTAPARVRIMSTNLSKQTALVSLTIHQGMNHQVKNMLASVGFPVEKLRRESYGDLDLTGLVSGEYRALKRVEIANLKKLSQEKEETIKEKRR